MAADSFATALSEEDDPAEGSVADEVGMQAEDIDSANESHCSEVS